jgi:hypothetical protein
MTSEHAIPALKPTSTNFPFWETAVRRHLDGVDILAGDPGWGSWLGIMVGIIHLLYIAQVTWNQITYAIARSPTTRQDSRVSIQLQTKRQCLWCKGIGHFADRCYAKDPTNLTRFPKAKWSKVPNYMTLKFNKKFTQEEAQKMVKEAATRHPQYYQASMDSTPPPPPPPTRTFTANPSDNNASSSIKTDRHRQEGRYNFLDPEAITEQEIAMEANTNFGDGFPKSHNLW